MWGKSPRCGVVTHHAGKPCGLKGPINRRMSAARAMPEGRPLQAQGQPLPQINGRDSAERQETESGL
jgi:hypothetical protein